MTTLVGTTDENGRWTVPISIEFNSDGDYFVLEGSFEKSGYSRELFSAMKDGFILTMYIIHAITRPSGVSLRIWTFE
ncbi:MAG: hypothetical protein IPO65_17915 [Saprospiraceae bacterium]|nr:hypothetical protein [Saprospiraceae bacterium]